MRLLAAACAAYAARDSRKAADMLCSAETVGRNSGLHREAAKIRKAMMEFWVQGGKPAFTESAGWGIWDRER